MKRLLSGAVAPPSTATTVKLYSLVISKSSADRRLMSPVVELMKNLFPKFPLSIAYEKSPKLPMSESLATTCVTDSEALRFSGTMTAYISRSKVGT